MMSPEVLIQAIHLASDPMATHQARVEASQVLNQVRSTALNDATNCSSSAQNNGGMRPIEAVLNLLVSASSDERVVFFALTILQACLEAQTPPGAASAGVPSSGDVQIRYEIRQVLLGNVLGIPAISGGGNASTLANGEAPSSLAPTYVKTKIGVMLALLIRADFISSWNTAFDDLMNHLLSGQQKQQPDPMDMIREEVYLRTLEAICDDIVDSPEAIWVDQCHQIKDVMRGYKLAADGGNIAPGASLTGRITDSLTSLIHRYRPLMSEAAGTNGNGSDNDALHRHAGQMTVLSVSVLKRHAPWVDLSLIVGDEAILNLLSSCITAAGTGGDDVDATPRTDLSVQATLCVSEVVGRGMESSQKVALIAQIDVYRRLHEAVQAGFNISAVDVTHVDAVIAVAELINKVGQELLSAWEEHLRGSNEVDVNTLATLLRQMMSLFFPCYEYDDIDVSGAVVSLASRLAMTLGKETDVVARGNGSSALAFTVSEHFPQLMTIMYQQMKYPEEYDFDFEDDEEAEEEQYRTALRKLYQAIVRVAPEVSLQFVCSILSGIASPLSTAPTSDLEASIRLVYHYCEGIRPPPGLKTVMKIDTFREVLVAIHQSDITSHPHREILMLYYDLSVRYYPILRDSPALLPPILGALSGASGLQHPHPRMRSRACYLLLKLIKSIPTVLRAYAETAVNGIQGLLSNPTAFPIEPDDKLYLFEAIDILLGKTGMEAVEQQRYLTAVMTPHVRSIEEILASPDAKQNSETFGNALASSISAIAFLSKGFRKPCQEVQVVLLETVSICLRVLQALPESDEVRSKVLIFLQRMILCIGPRVLPPMPTFLDLLITHCTNQDVLDVSHLLNQLCSKFKEEAIGAVDATVSPFLRKCYSLMPTFDEVVQGDIPPHLLTEQLSIKKISYAVLEHVATYKVTPVLLSSNNLGSIEQVLQYMSEGALNVQDPTMKKTCITFFRELVDQWAADGSIPNEHIAVQRGFNQFIGETIVPGLIKAILDPSFNENDAMQARNVTQVAKLLSVLREKRGDSEYEQIFIGNVLARLQCPSEIITAFRGAREDKEIEKILREMLAALKQPQTS